MNTFPTQAKSSQFMTVETVVDRPPNTVNLNTLFPTVTPQQLLLLLGCAVALVALGILQGDVKSGSTRRNAKAKGKWASRKEMLAARKLAIKQLNGRQRKSAAVWIIRPTTLVYPNEACDFKGVKGGKQRKLAPKVGAIPKDQPVVVRGEKQSFYSEFEKKRFKAETVWIPDTQRSIMVVGAPGSGKTFSAIDPMLRSIVEQGYPCILYDFKYPTQTSAIAAYAQQMGYTIRVFAPGFPESDVLNLLDFLTGDPQVDASLARQLANVLNTNFKESAASSDPFFDNAGDQLVQAVMMLARQMPHADLMTAQVILSAPQLVDRLFPESSGLEPWIRKAFDQLFSVKDSEKTVSSIIGTATLNFTRLMMAKILACCVGKTTLPLDLDGKTMVVFGLDREIRDVVAPIVATAIHMIVNRNLFRKGGRKDPLYVVLDEFPTVKLKQFVNWANESRSDGFNGIIGFQNKSQLEKAYGKEMALAMMGGCATKFIFNPGELESAEYFSKYFGQEEIARKNISRSSGGGKGSRSTSQSVEVGTRSLIAPEEFVSLPPGTCYFTNPAYSNDEMAYLPRRLKINLPPQEIKLAAEIEAQWEPLRRQLIQRIEKDNLQRIPTEADVLLRMREFDEKFPIPNDEKEKAPSAADILAGMF
jgi:type IV secretory pathway TraG/TraD family ATPase VirD4